MGIEKPFEVETGRLRDPPPAPRRVPIEERVRTLVQPVKDGVLVAGHLLQTAGDPERAARDLRGLLTHRLEERRPNVDAHAWARFVEVVHGVVRDRRYADYDLSWTLLEAVDGL